MKSKPKSTVEGHATGGRIKPKGVMPATKGQPMNPLTKAKMNNGIPGYKKGGIIKGCKC